MDNRAQIRRPVAIAVVAMLLASACGGVASAPDELALVDTPTSSAVATTTSTTTSIVPSTTSTSATTTIAPDPYRTWIATAHESVSHLVAYEVPGGAELALPFLVPNPHQFG
ncbi:MAG: hypothetical protein ACR2P0_20045, partial [Acidimicrobiales bacterium]